MSINPGYLPLKRLIRLLWKVVGKAYNAMKFAAQSAKYGNQGLMFSGFSAAHDGVLNELHRAKCLFLLKSAISVWEAPNLITTVANLALGQTRASDVIVDKWPLAVATRKRQAVYDNLQQQRLFYDNWSKAFNDLMPAGTKNMGDGMSGPIRKI
jgi:hypothetical protein